MIKVLLVNPDIHSKERLLTMLNWNRLGITIHLPRQQTCENILLSIDKHRYSLIVINMKPLPSFSMQLCEQIRRSSRVPIILIGGNKDFNIVRKAIALHVSDYLPDPFEPQDLESCLMNLRDELSTQSTVGDQNSLSSAIVPRSSTSTTIIEMIKQYVQEQMHQNITLKQISNMLHFNCAYLGQKFKRHENMTFNEYLLQQRMEKAKKLLLETDMRIYEIAHKVGYTEVDWFYKKFKEYTGKSANEFRKKTSYSA